MNEAERIKVLADLVKLPTVNDNEVTAAKYIQQLLASHGIKAKILPVTGNRANLVAEIGTHGPVLGFSGHLDVVAASQADGWHSDPFTLTERDGQLFGRGTSDMKSGVAAMVIAMIELAEHHFDAGRLRLLLTMGEEVGEAGSAYFAEHGYMDDVAALVISEPTYYRVIYAEKGSLDFDITSTGKAAHSSMPQVGFNALNPLIEILAQLNDFFATPPTNDILGPVTFNATVMRGGEQVNTIPDHATVAVNARTLPNFDGDAVLAHVNKLISAQNEQGAQLTLNVIMNEPAVVTSADTPLANLAAKLAQHHGQSGEKTVAPGITDASNLVRGKENNYPFIVFGPGNPTASHQVDESVERAAYLDFIQIYQELATAYFEENK